MKTTHELSVVHNVAEVSAKTKRKPATIKFALSYARYLDVYNREAESLVEKLLEQVSGGNVKIVNLRLMWEEEESDV